MKYTLTKTAEYLGISRVTLYKYIELGYLKPRHTPGGKPFFLEEELIIFKEVLDNGISVSED